MVQCFLDEIFSHLNLKEFCWKNFLKEFLNVFFKAKFFKFKLEIFRMKN